MVLSLVLGAIVGELLDIETWLNGLGGRLKKKMPEKLAGSTFVDGFVTASMLFCVGAMAIVGSLQDGLTGNYSTLAAKAVLDGISSVLLAASLGFGVVVSSAPLFIYQGGITLLAQFISPLLQAYPALTGQLNCVGSILIFAIGINMAERLRDINPAAEAIPFNARYEAATREMFFARRFDYIVDCIDLVACKLDLIETAVDRGIPIISALGAGNKADASLLRLSDIAKTESDPLARVVRKELRKRGITHLPVVYSGECGMKPGQAEQPPPGRRSIPGSLVWVTATAGMLLCSHDVVIPLRGYV